MISWKKKHYDQEEAPINTKRLKQAEKTFMARYPEVLAIAKKHRMEKMVELSQTGLAPEMFKDPES